MINDTPEGLVDDMQNGATCAPDTDYANYASRQWNSGDGNQTMKYGTCDATCPENLEPGSVTICLDPSSVNLPDGNYPSLVANDNFANWNG